MWEDAEEFIEALEGEFGEEEQEQAETFAQQTGLLDQWDAEGESATEQEYINAVAQEFFRVEETIGRQLTQTEVQAMIDSIGPQEHADLVVPDFTAEYGPQLASARESEEGRVHLGASAAQEVLDQQAEEESRRPRPGFEPPQPAGEPDDEDGYE